jgi:hypothetical protein
MKLPIIDNPNQLWQNHRAVYPLYTSLAGAIGIEVQPCQELAEDLGIPSAETLSDAGKWLEEMDRNVQVHQLRHFLQTAPGVTEDTLRDLLLHHLSKPQPTDHDRDKVDFLLVQFLSLRVPGASDVSLEAVAAALVPVLGTFEREEPVWLAPLSGLIARADNAPDLSTLFSNRIIEQGREVKIACGEKFFEPVAMAAFARFGFLIRRRFFRLMHEDLNAILDGLLVLESRGVRTLDCQKAQFSADEPVLRLRMICQSWKVMFQAEYSAGQPLAILVDLRKAVESALAQSSGNDNMKKKAASAAGESGQAAETDQS